MNREQAVALVMLGVVGLSCGQLSAPRGDPPDFQAYMAEVRKLGMTESASGDLSTVAMIRTGASLLRFLKDEITGEYSPSYESTACPVPGADPEMNRQWHAELQERIDHDMELLRKQADWDGSSFVSTVEGSEFRKLVEFGYLANHIVASEPAAAAVLARAARMAADQVASRVAQYNALARQLNESSEFKAPLVDLTEAEARAAKSGPGA